jgi:hypothetical protein
MPAVSRAAFGDELVDGPAVFVDGAVDEDGDAGGDVEVRGEVTAGARAGRA